MENSRRSLLVSCSTNGSGGASAIQQLALRPLDGIVQDAIRFNAVEGNSYNRDWKLEFSQKSNYDTA